MRADIYRKRRQRRQRIMAAWLLGVALLVIVAAGVLLLLLPRGGASSARLGKFAKENGLSVDVWPKELVELMEKNPETEGFVLNYPFKKGLTPQIDLSGCVGGDSVPLLLQWDERWGYGNYAGELMGLSGCGPTCLSMVCLYLLEDATYTPRYIAEFAEENGYSERGNGSKWTLISEGGKALGLDVEELPLHENTIARELKDGNPVICVVGPGDFTTTGHFIVLTEYIDGMVTVNDPNSALRSTQQWKLSDVMTQIKNLWVCRP